MNTKSGTAMNEKLDPFDHAIDPTTPRPTVEALEPEQADHAHDAERERDLHAEREEQEHQPDEERADERLAHAWSSGATSSRNDGGPSRIFTCRASAAA